MAAVASFLFPGAGQALTRNLRRALIWAGAGALPVLLWLWLPQAVALAFAVRIAAGVDAFVVVRRAERAKAKLDLMFAGAVAIGQTVVYAALQALVIESFVAQSTSMAPTVTIGDHVFVDKLTPRFAGYERGEIVVFQHPFLDVKYLKRIAAVGGDEVAVREGVLYVNGRAAAQTAIGDTGYWDLVDEERGTWTQKRAVAYREDLAGHVHTIFRSPHLAAEAVYFHDFPSRLQSCESAGPGQVYEASTQARPANAPAMTATPDGTACVIPRGTYFILGDNRDNSNDSRSWGIVPEANLIGRVVGIWWSSNRKDGRQLGRIGRIE